MRALGERALLAGLVVPLLLLGLGSVALTDRDEGANAGAAREMLEQGSWITPTLDYAPRFAKPAFVYWLMATAYLVLGVGETAARLPSAVAAGVLVLVQHAFARWAFGPAAGLRAAVILLLSVEYVAIGRMALTDAVLVLWTSSAAFTFFRAQHGSPPCGRWYAAMYGALALGMLTKGPIGVLVPVLGIAAYLTVAAPADGWRRLWREGRPGWGLLLFLAVAAPWYAAMLWTHGADYLGRAGGETLGRALRTVTGPGGTALFYVPVLLVGFFPWSAFLPAALVGALRGARIRAAADRRGAATVFAAASIVAGLVFFSLLPSRLPHYVAPLFPLAALLVAGVWPETAPRLARGLLATVGLTLGAALVAAGMMGATLTRLLARAYPADPSARIPLEVFALAGLAWLAAGSAAIRDGAVLFRMLAAVTVAFLLVGLHGVLPALSREFVAPAGDLARRAAQSAAPCDALVAFGPYRPSLTFYARGPVAFVDVPDRARLAELAARPGRLFLVTPKAARNALPPALGALPVLEARGGYVLLASGRSAGSCAGLSADRPRS